MAGNVWSIMIVPGTECASFVPDVYGTESSITLQAQVNDLVSWNNQTGQEHEIWEKGATGDTQLTQQIEPWTSSTPGYCVAGTVGIPIEYYCSIHPEEKGSITVNA